jgi:CheY-like chemotaxis protein
VPDSPEFVVSSKLHTGDRPFVFETGCAILDCSSKFLRTKALISKTMLDQVPILLAEDNKNDIALMRRGFAEAAIPNPVLVVKHGREVVEYLSGKGDYADREKFPLPGLMLLDLKMPWMDGFDVLSWLRRQPQFDGLPVVLLTSSKLQPEIAQSRLLGVYDYRVKPHDFAELVSLLADLRKCWLDERSNHFGEMLAVSGGKNPASSGGEISGPPET